MKGFTLVAKAIRSIATEEGFNVVFHEEDNFVEIKGTNFGVAWLGKFDFEVVTNYTKDGKWQHCHSNPVSGDFKDCTLAAIRKARYWSRKNNQTAA